MNNSTIKNFNATPRTNRPRSLFSPKGSVKTSFNSGKLVPIAVREVLPNTTIKLDLHAVVRGITPLAPVLDNAYCDVYAFFVPNRLSWTDWEKFLSNPEPEAYSSPVELSVPQVTFSGSSSNATFQTSLAGTFWDYAGLGSANAEFPVSAMPGLSVLYPRGYVRIWNEWFRNENIQSSAHLYTDGVDRVFSFSTDPLISAEYGGSLLPVCKYNDYFTSALPSPQKHPAVLLPLGETAPVFNNSNPSLSDVFSPLLYHYPVGQAAAPLLEESYYLGNSYGFIGNPDIAQNNLGYRSVPAGTPASGGAGMALQADLSQAEGVSVNTLRLAFQTQRFYERLARSGSRYTELLQSMFGVYASDTRLQRPEFLGGIRFPITQHQVAQTAENEGSQTIGLGDTGAFVFAGNSKRNIVDKSFPEHGILYFLACVRTDQSYCQGVPVEFTRRDRFDFYFPAFAHIGEQPIMQSEIYYSGPSTLKTVFGYKEPWVEYKYMENKVTGRMRPYVSGNFGIWSYSNYFRSAPTLTPNFINQDVSNIDRTLAVTSSVQDQFFADFYFDFKQLILPMPLYNTPGLIDHD